LKKKLNTSSNAKDESSKDELTESSENLPQLSSEDHSRPLSSEEDSSDEENYFIPANEIAQSSGYCNIYFYWNEQEKIIWVL